MLVSIQELCVASNHCTVFGVSVSVPGAYSAMSTEVMSSPVPTPSPPPVPNPAFMVNRHSADNAQHNSPLPQPEPFEVGTTAAKEGASGRVQAMVWSRSNY